NRSKETVFKEFIRSIKVKDAEYETEKGLTRLYGLIKNIKDILSLKIDYDVFQFKPTLLKIFGEKLLLSEMIEYLYLISSKTKRVRPYREQSGINISMMNEPLPDGKFIIFTDLIEGVFLKSSSTINILNKDSYKTFHQELYGVDQDTALLENFRTFISGKTKKIAFILPLWGDDIIVSTYLNKILSQFPKKKMDIKIAGDIHGLNSDPRLKDISFNLTINDVKDDENILKNIPVMIEKDNLVNNEFAIDLKEGEIEKYLSSASKIESFMSCPAKFVHDLNNGYDAIESQRPFTYGNLLHSVTEELINFYKGKGLLTEMEFNALSENFMSKSKGSIVESKLNLFTEYCFTGAIGDFDLKLSFDLLKSKLDDAGIDKKIADYKTEQLQNDPYSDHSIEQKLYEAVGFLIRFILELGPTPEYVTRTFVTEVKFDNMIISEDPKIVIKQGYIDFLYVDFENETRLYDIKSTKKFQDYEDELSSYQKVQVLIYKEAIERWIREHGLVNFDVKNDGYNKDCTILDDSYKKYMISLHVDPYYISPKRPYVLSCREQSWDEFLNQLQVRLNDQKKFYPISNSNCQYCELGSSCPKNEQSKFVLPPDMNENTNFINTAEIFKFKKKKAKEKADTKNFILFDGDKDKAVRSNNDVIISAGAGAGKTEVLSSKYVRLLIDEYDTDIENIVCITFTNKAAGEMQNRIYSKLNDVIESKIFVTIDQGKDLSNYIVDEKIIRKLIKVREKFFEKNLISTFHSFCNLFITKYGSFSSNLTDYDINQSISEDFKIDSEITKFLKKEYETGFKDIFNGKFTTEEIEIFEKWLLKKHLIYSGDNQGGFIPDLKNLMNEMRLSGKELSAEKWIKPLDDYLQEEKDIFEEWGEEYSEHKKRVLLLLEQHINSTEDETKISKLKIAHSKVLNGEKFNFLRDISGKLFSEVKEVVNSMKKLSLYKLINEGSTNFDLSKYEWTIKKAIVNIIFALTDHIIEYKKLNGLIEQNDLHLIFLELLKDNMVLKELKDQFKHILVDEFQDTNWLQDKIIESLKTEK
ncbi:MAG: AAA family ATPase, partial [Candidatus Delongbacteria bacterium]|nr:AAA family ATPase [Candidatus Delongbacteria bacterium]